MQRPIRRMARRDLADLRRQPRLAVGKKRVARLMRAAGLRGADGSRSGPRTTIREPAQPSAPDLVDRQFARSAPNRLWVATSSTCRPGRASCFGRGAGCLQPADRGLVERDDLQADLVLDALGMAVTARGAECGGVVAHSDHGSQYTSLRYGRYAKQSRIELEHG